MRYESLPPTTAVSVFRSKIPLPASSASLLLSHRLGRQSSPSYLASPALRRATDLSWDSKVDQMLEVYDLLPGVTPIARSPSPHQTCCRATAAARLGRPAHRRSPAQLRRRQHQRWRSAATLLACGGLAMLVLPSLPTDLCRPLLPLLMFDACGMLWYNPGSKRTTTSSCRSWRFR